MPHAREADLRRLADDVVERLRSMKTGLSGDDSPFTNLWLEYAAQVQEQHGILFSEYERIVRAKCERRVDDASPADVEWLWPATKGFGEWTEDGHPGLGEQR